MTEQWRPVVGFEGRYEVSDQGRVRSLDFSRESRNRWGGKSTYRRKGKALQPGRMSVGYLSVCLGRGHTRTVHSLVAEAFLGPCPEGQEVCHLDGDRANPVLSNLRYGTRSSNNRDIVGHGGRKLTVDEVKRVREVAGSYFGSGRALAKELGVTESHISCIKRRRYYTQVQK